MQKIRKCKQKEMTERRRKGFWIVALMIVATLLQSTSVSAAAAISVECSLSGIPSTKLITAEFSEEVEDADKVLKIKESSSAESSLKKALETEFDTYDDLYYYCMDMTLYDKGGKIPAGIDDVAVVVVCPIPSDLVSLSDELDVVSVNEDGEIDYVAFEVVTVSKVKCVEMYAEHFSAYAFIADKEAVDAAKETESSEKSSSSSTKDSTNSSAVDSGSSKTGTSNSAKTGSTTATKDYSPKTGIEVSPVVVEGICAVAVIVAVIFRTLRNKERK